MSETRAVGANKFSLSKMSVYLILVLGSLFSLFPFYWMSVMSTHLNNAIVSVPPKVLFGDQMWLNLEKVLEKTDFFGAMWNSFVVSSGVAIGQLFLCSLAGFAFAKFRFPGSKVLFATILLTMMVPPQLGILPLYDLMARLGWLGQLQAIIVPGLVGAFGIFWMRQYISDAVPDELIDAAKIDGCTNFRIYWNVAVPAILPAFAMLGIITFMYTWNDFLGPLIILRPNPDAWTVQIALRELQTDPYRKDYGMIVSGIFWSTLPLIIVFLAFNKLFISSITEGAVKS
jgi:cellobiose transport system permease protein